jgi:hypothetical protein
LRTLTTLTFVYVPREDRIMAAINAGRPDAWSCWLTRRLTLAVLDRTREFLESKSDLAQRAPVELRHELAAFEREAAIAKTKQAMSVTPPDILKSSANAAELAERLAITHQNNGFRLELRGQGDNGAVGLFNPAELQRMLQMLQAEVGKTGWLELPAKAPAQPAPAAPKPVRH